MIFEQINGLIMAAMKSGRDENKVDVYRLIKNEFIKFKTQPGTPKLTDAEEIRILQKMVKQREDSIKCYTDAGRFDLADEEKQEMAIIKTLLPKTPSEEDVKAYISYWYPDGIEKKEMGTVIKTAKNELIGVDGKILADVVKSFIKP